MVQEATRRLPSSTLRLASAAICLTLLSACGDSRSTPTTPSTPCVQTSLLQGTGQIPANIADFETFTTTATGRVDITIDWTSSSNRIGLAVAQDPCTFDQLKAGNCKVLLDSMSPPKPLKGSIPNLAPGNYVLIIGNTNSVDESISVQVTLNTGTCPAPASTASIQSQSFAGGIVGNISRILRH